MRIARDVTKRELHEKVDAVFEAKNCITKTPCSSCFLFGSIDCAGGRGSLWGCWEGKSGAEAAGGGASRQRLRGGGPPAAQEPGMGARSDRIWPAKTPSGLWHLSPDAACRLPPPGPSAGCCLAVGSVARPPARRGGRRAELEPLALQGVIRQASSTDGSNFPTGKLYHRLCTSKN